MNVRGLIAELIQYDMDAEVFIGLGSTAIPSGHGKVHSVADYANSTPTPTPTPRGSDDKCPFGVYVIPTDHLVCADV